MNGYLLDTHVLLWWLSDPTRLKKPARAAIADGANIVYLSAAAAWEMAIKKSLGRLAMPTNLVEVLAAEQITVLDISLEHALAVADLPRIHDDPFDRMQIAQAQLEKLTLVTRDRTIQAYPINWMAA